MKVLGQLLDRSYIISCVCIAFIVLIYHMPYMFPSVSKFSYTLMKEEIPLKGRKDITNYKVKEGLASTLLNVNSLNLSLKPNLALPN